MSALDHARAAERLLDRGGHGAVPERKVDESVARSRIALALGVIDLAAAAEAETFRPISGPWPDGVAARFVTAYGSRFGDLRAAVDMVEADGDERSVAICRPCNRVVLTHGRDYRNEVLDAAARHASNCMAMPQPTAGEGVR